MKNNKTLRLLLSLILFVAKSCASDGYALLEEKDSRINTSRSGCCQIAIKDSKTHSCQFGISAVSAIGTFGWGVGLSALGATAKTAADCIICSTAGGFFGCAGCVFFACAVRECTLAQLAAKQERSQGQHSVVFPAHQQVMHDAPTNENNEKFSSQHVLK